MFKFQTFHNNKRIRNKSLNKKLKKKNNNKNHKLWTLFVEPGRDQDNNNNTKKN